MHRFCWPEDIGGGNQHGFRESPEGGIDRMLLVFCIEQWCIPGDIKVRSINVKVDSVLRPREMKLRAPKDFCGRAFHGSEVWELLFDWRCPFFLSLRKDRYRGTQLS